MTRKEQYDKYISSEEWRLLRRQKLDIDPYCELCGASCDIHVHHLKYMHLTDVGTKQLMTLCEFHHRFVHQIMKSRLIKRHHKASTTRRLIKKLHNRGIGATV